MVREKEHSIDDSRSDLHPAIMERIKDLGMVKAKHTELFCPLHPDEPGEVSCAICDQLFCKSCVRPFKTLHLCKEHLPLLMNLDWKEVLTLKTSTSDPEQGVRLYDVKKELFHNDNIPTYIETHYKINVDQDHIETYLVLHALTDSIDQVQEKLIKFNS